MDCEIGMSVFGCGARTRACRVETLLDASAPWGSGRRQGVPTWHAGLRAPRLPVRRCEVIIALVLRLPAADPLRDFAVAARVIGLQMDHGLWPQRLKERVRLQLVGDQNVVYHP